MHALVCLFMHVYMYSPAFMHTWHLLSKDVWAVPSHYLTGKHSGGQREPEYLS